MATWTPRSAAAQAGLAKADKKADRAAEGRIVLARDAGKGVLVEINSSPTSSPRMPTSSACRQRGQGCAAWLTSKHSRVRALRERRNRRGSHALR